MRESAIRATQGWLIASRSGEKKFRRVLKISRGNQNEGRLYLSLVLIDNAPLYLHVPGLATNTGEEIELHGIWDHVRDNAKWKLSITRRLQSSTVRAPNESIRY